MGIKNNTRNVGGICCKKMYISVIQGAGIKKDIRNLVILDVRFCASM